MLLFASFELYVVLEVVNVPNLARDCDPVALARVFCADFAIVHKRFIGGLTESRKHEVTAYHDPSPAFAGFTVDSSYVLRVFE